MAKTKTVTLAQIIDAIEENGYEVHRGDFFDYDFDTPGDPIISACALGQAGLNLGITVWGYDSFQQIPINTRESLGKLVVELNDRPTRAGNFRSIQQIVDIVRKHTDPSYLNLKYTFEVETHDALKSAELAALENERDYALAY